MSITSAPRSGGRTAAQQPSRTRFPTQGTSALKPAPQPDPLLQQDPESQGRPAANPDPRPLRVAPPLPVLVPRAPFIALILVLVVGGVLGILVLNTKINENAFRLHDLREKQADLDQRQQDLEQRLADYESPNNLAAAACKLGLVSAGAPAFIRLPDGRVIGVPQPATGTTCVSSHQAGGGQQAGGTAQRQAVGTGQQAGGTGQQAGGTGQQAGGTGQQAGGTGQQAGGTGQQAGGTAHQQAGDTAEQAGGEGQQATGADQAATGVGR
jgi:hypothetical protein